ncbi:MAG: T9SS type A sorting domain-containing protein, partial [Bacteroidetes bacterium]|nr:T9SS type A sorting domain-containing protein [Bacteroidota bacterium]
SSLEEVRLRNMPEIPHINLQNGNNTNIHFLQITNNPNLDCVQVDDPAAVMAGTDPPYDSWTIDNGPIITDDCQLGIADYLQSQIKLYPNPVANKLYLQTSDRVDIEAIRIYDLMGKKMLETKANSVLDVSLLSKGVYLVSITTNKGILTEKLFKE